MKKTLLLAATLALLSAPALAQSGSMGGSMGGGMSSGKSEMMAPARSKRMMHSKRMSSKKMMHSKRMSSKKMMRSRGHNMM